MSYADRRVRGIWFAGWCRVNPAESRHRRVPSGLASAALVFLFLGAGIEEATAHNAPSGWTYPMACCRGVDCHEVEAGSIKEGPKGYVIRSTGEVIPMTDSRVRNSPDGEFHRCSIAGMDNTPTVCLFVPPRDF